MSQEKTTLAYWAIRGLGQPIRLLLTYVGEEFIDFKYTIGPAPEYSRQDWYDTKATLTDIPLINLPYYIDGDNKISHSNAIIRYIGRKYNLLGDTEQERIRVDMMENEANDFRNGTVMVGYNPNYTYMLPNYLKDITAKLKSIEDFLGENPWFAGQKITIVDFPMYELLDQHLIMSPECLNPFPKLCAFQDRFEALPAIKKYMSSSAFLKRPINNINAAFF